MGSGNKRRVSMRALISAVDKTVSAIKEKPLHVLLSIAVDILFLMAYGFFIPPLTEQTIKEATVLAETLVGQNTGRERLTLFGALWQDPKVVFTTITLLAVFFAIYAVFQGINWQTAHEISKKQTSFWRYIKSFAVVNLLWIPWFVAYKIFDIVFGIRAVLLQKLAQQEQSVFISALLLTVFIVLLMLHFISLTLLSIKKSVNFVIKNWKETLGMYLLIASWLLAIVFLLNIVNKVQQSIAFVLAGALFLFYLVFSRVFIIQTVSILKKNVGTQS